jgi:uncharacterized protein YjiS (DUF1127 family)
MVGLARAAGMVRSRRTRCTGTNALPQAASAMTACVRRLLNARAIAIVSSLSDRQLNDIGLTSADIRWAVRQPLHIDTSGEFARLVNERRFGRGQRTS